MKTLALIPISVFIAFLFVEMLSRLVSDEIGLFYFENQVTVQVNLLASAYPATHDPHFGYIPTPGYSGRDPAHWHNFVTLDALGIRSNGNKGLDISRDPAILAVGNSFVYGDEVSNDETWPAYLEKMLKRRVYNGGVFGYGIDQTILRAEKLVAELKPSILLVGMIPEDIVRAELSVRTGVPKPYFDIVDERLVLKNSPVPNTRPQKSQIGWTREIFGYSYFLHWLMRNMGYSEWWVVGNWPNRVVHSKGVEVTCLLWDRLQELAAKNQISLYLVTQYPPPFFRQAEAAVPKDHAAKIKKVLACAKERNIKIVDSYSPLLQAFDSNRQLFDSYYVGHMTPAGNQFVARHIYEDIFKQ